MKSCRSDIERLVPVLRQVARALVESHRADVADDLVQDALDEVIREERSWSSAEVETRLFTRLIAANRLRLRAEADERRTAPGHSARTDNGAMRSSASPPRLDAVGLESLPLGDREALVLVVLGRLEYGRVTEVLGLPLGTLVARLSHARDALGSSLWSPPVATRTARAHLRLVKG